MAQFTTLAEENAATIDAVKNDKFTASRSPFQDGVKFTVDGYAFKDVIIDGEKVNKAPCLVLTTSVGDLFLSTLFKSKACADGKVVRPKGTFVQQVNELITPDITNEGLLKAIVKAFKGKQIVVKRIDYIAQNGNKQSAYSYYDFDVVE